MLFAGIIIAFGSSLRRAKRRIATAEKRVAELLAEVAERRRAEVDLREGERRWRSIIETLPQLVWGATADGLVNYFSPRSSEFTGRPEGDMLGSGWLDSVHPDDRQAGKDAWTESVTEEREYWFEHRFRRADGVYRWFLCHANPIRDGDGRVVGWAGASIDVTERKHLEQRFRKLQKHLELATRTSGLSLWELVLPDRSVENGYFVPSDQLWPEEYDATSLGDLFSSMTRAGIRAGVSGALRPDAPGMRGRRGAGLRARDPVSTEGRLPPLAARARSRLPRPARPSDRLHRGRHRHHGAQARKPGNAQGQGEARAGRARIAVFHLGLRAARWRIRTESSRGVQRLGRTPAGREDSRDGRRVRAEARDRAGGSRACSRRRRRLRAW